jgi:hypothetical protein
MYLAVAGWGHIHGLVMLEIYNQLRPFFCDCDALYQAEAESLLQQVGLNHK